MSFVIRDPATGLYAQVWYSCPLTGDRRNDTLKRIDWVPKAQASSYRKRSELRDILPSCPHGSVVDIR